MRGGVADESVPTSAGGRRPPTSLIVDAMDARTIKAIRTRLVTWYRRHGSDLPWRRTRDPYALLVAEVLLQRTPRARVAPVFSTIVKQFPTVGHLAAASVEDIHASLAPLGLVRRADRLVAAARAAVERHGAIIPDRLDDLESLPGVGPYVARAVLCFAFGRPEVLVDAVSSRVYRRLFGLVASTGKPGQDVKALATLLVPKRTSREFNYGILDLAGTYCRRTRPECSECPLRRTCRSAPR